ncbi:hypothetical protein H311_04420 [Anncaliia algerae PRA109]|nr:hypothetical protein H311_04420 [Anncaliia algerae PRA109]
MQKIFKKIFCEERKFFEKFDVDIQKVFKVLGFFACKIQDASIIRNLSISKNTLKKIKDKLFYLMKLDYDKMNKLGGPSTIVQIDETMMNYKCKSHRGRSPLNKTDAFCTVEFTDKITKAYATTIFD